MPPKSPDNVFAVFKNTEKYFPDFFVFQKKTSVSIQIFFFILLILDTFMRILSLDFIIIYDYSNIKAKIFVIN